MSDFQKVKEIFTAASGINSKDREGFLRNECGTDEALFAEIKSLLEAGEETEQILEEKAFGVRLKLPAVGKNYDFRKFGKYTILREIGRGGMGAVFLAERNDGEFEQKVALKIVRQSFADAGIERHFRRERQILARLNHPNIAKLSDGGVSETGELFLVMEYVEGKSLIEYAETRNLSVEEKLRLFLKICRAVSYAHQNLIVHRDIKPSNILISEDGEPKLLDFGLAKITENNAADSKTNGAFVSDYTKTNFHAFTPAYASPEQILGKNISTSSDVYSLGVVLFELLTGNKPFRFEDGSLQEILKTIDSVEPARPSSITNFNDGKRNSKLKAQDSRFLKGDLDNIILKSIRKEPERRYKSVEQFAADIERHLKGLPVLARPQTLSYRAAKFINRNKVAAAAAAIIFITLLSGIVATLRQSSIAREERDKAQSEKAKAQATSDFLAGMLNYADPKAGFQREMSVKEILDNAANRLENENLSAPPEVKAELRQIIAYSYSIQGFYEESEKHIRISLRESIELYGEDSVAVLKIKVLLAEVLGQRGKISETSEIFFKILPVLQSKYQKRQISADYLADALHNFGVTRRAQGDSAEAEKLLREAFVLIPEISDDSKDLISLIRGTLALTLFDQGKLDEAIAMARENVNYQRENTDADSPGFAYALTTLGSYVSEKGDYAEAEAALSEAETIYRKLLGGSHLWLGDNLRLQANIFYQQDKLEQARSKINETLKIYRANTSRQYINYPTALIIEGLILNKAGETVEAEKILREAVRIRLENLPKNHYLNALAESALGECLANQMRFKEAEPLLLESYESLRQSQGERNPRTLLAKSRLDKFREMRNKA